MNEIAQEPDCAVCLQKCHHPTRLPCGHVFCFLCVKGIAIQSKKCAMCRADIPSDYLDHPILLEKISSQQAEVDISNEYQWYYEGRNGWWKYDERSNNELETVFNAGEAICTLLLAGALYTIDFQSMMQVRRSDQTRRRRVRRDIPTLPAKGVAGIKNLSHIQSHQTKSNEQNETHIHSEQTENEIIEILDEDDTVNESVESNTSGDIATIFSTIQLLDQDSPQDLTREET